MVNVLTLKKETVPKSDKHSIDTKANPAIIAGLADGKIILNNVYQFLVLVLYVILFSFKIF